MAIQPPSDILLDVANAADPTKVRAATARLAKLAAEPTTVDADFGKALKAADSAGRALAGKGVAGNGVAGNGVAGKGVAGVLARPFAMPSGPGTASRSSAHDPAHPYQKFEAVLLQNFVEAILPKDDDLYGDKTSSGIYRSMMAEQFANELSKAGGIGIAKAIEAKHPSQTSAAADATGVTPSSGPKPINSRV